MTTPNNGRSIELFFVDGDAGGMLTATIPFQWTGHVLVANRTQLVQALKRPEMERPGIYLLIGDVEGKTTLYIGETDEIGVRLKQHAAQKDWWSTAICITSQGDPLNKAHARFLESRLLNDAKRLRKIRLDNSQTPPVRTLSEASEAHMENFIENIYLVLPALRYDFFSETLPDEKPKSTSVRQQLLSEPTYFVLEVKKPGIRARARLVAGRFIVEKGSLAREKWVGTTSIQSTYGTLFQELVDQGVLLPEGRHRVYSQDYAFNSPSAAAAVTAGRPTSGPVHWKLEGTDISYGEWEQRELSQVDDGGEDA